MKTMKYFSATWCGPCQTFKPTMKELASEGYNIEFIDVDEDSDVASAYNIRSVPTEMEKSTENFGAFLEELTNDDRPDPPKEDSDR